MPGRLELCVSYTNSLHLSNSCIALLFVSNIRKQWFVAGEGGWVLGKEMVTMRPGFELQFHQN